MRIGCLLVGLAPGVKDGTDPTSAASARLSCGAAALQVACGLLEVQVDPRHVQQHLDLRDDGSCSMLGLKTCAERLGLFACGLEMSVEDLALFRGVGIAHTLSRSRSSHYVVIAGVRDGHVLVVDPLSPRRSAVRWMPLSAMAEMWTGRMLVLSRTRLKVVPGCEAVTRRPQVPPPGTSPAGSALPAVASAQPAGLVQAGRHSAVPRIQAPGGIDFGSVVRGELETRTFVVRPQEGIRVRAVTSSHPALTVRMDPPAEASGQGDMSLAAMLDTSLITTSGPWRGLLRLDAGDGEPTGLTIEATAEIVEPVVVNPRRLWLGRVACGRESMHTAGVRIHASSTRILGVHGSDPSLVARLPEDQRGNDMELTCRWTPESVGPYKGKIIIETDHPLRPSIELPCYGIAIQEAR